MTIHLVQLLGTCTSLHLTKSARISAVIDGSALKSSSLRLSYPAAFLMTELLL